MSQISSPERPAGTDVVTLSPASRRTRLAVTAVILALLLGGTVWGDDSEFPFGPFRMYSTRNDPNAPVVSTRVVGLTAAGDEIRLSGGEVGLRRAEFEGQVNRLREAPELLASLAEVYARRHPEAPEMVTVHVVQRRYELTDGLRTGDYTDVVVADHDLAGTP